MRARAITNVAEEPDKCKYKYPSWQRSAILDAVGLRDSAGAEALMDKLARAAWDAVNRAQNDVHPHKSAALAQLKRLRHAINSLDPEVRDFVDATLEDTHFPFGEFSLRLVHVLEVVELAEKAVPEICAETVIDKNGHERGLRTADEAAGDFIRRCCLFWWEHTQKPLPRKVKHTPNRAESGSRAARPSIYRFVHAAMPHEVLECRGKDISYRVNAVLPRVRALLELCPNYPHLPTSG